MQSIIDFPSLLECPVDSATEQKQNEFVCSAGVCRRLDRFFSPTLRSEGEIHSTAHRKPAIFNKQFTSLFTHEPSGLLSDKNHSPDPTMPDVFISKERIQKMLPNIKSNKAAGPDSLPDTLKKPSHEITLILDLIYRKSIQSAI